MTHLFQVGDHVIAAVAFRDIPQGTEGTITHVIAEVVESYNVRFEYYPLLTFVPASMLAAAPPECGEKRPKPKEE